jgi:hypothetical protein
MDDSLATPAGVKRIYSKDGLTLRILQPDAWERATGAGSVVSSSATPPTPAPSRCVAESALRLSYPSTAPASNPSAEELDSPDAPTPVS